MRSSKLVSLPALAGVLLCTLASLSAAQSNRPPNVVVFLADDAGWGDYSINGNQSVRTPNIDSIGLGGARFDRFFVCAVCAPTRAEFLTGRYHSRGGVRGVSTGLERLNTDEKTVADAFKAAGYATGAFGKWGLGPPGSEGDPLRQGFDRFFGYNCQRRAHNHYPVTLWEDGRQVILNNPDFPSHQRLPAGIDPNAPASYARYTGRDYAPDRIHTAALDFIRANRARPFLCFIPTTIPHLALQVPEDSLKEYEHLGPEEPYRGGGSYLPHRRPRAAYAAMVSRMDAEVGRIVALLRELGLEQETLIVFTSDNGPLWDRFGGTDSGYFGSAGSFRGRKGSLYEGGVRVPGIVCWPGRIPAGSESSRMVGFEDWLPTLLELAGASRLVPQNLDGVSIVPTLLGKRQPPRRPLYREFPAYGGQQAIWSGSWKAIRQGLTNANASLVPPTELYDLERDPGETDNLAARQPGVVRKLELQMQREHTGSDDFPIPALDGPDATGVRGRTRPTR